MLQTRVIKQYQQVKRKQKSVFEELFKEKICFAVIATFKGFKMVSFNETHTEYAIIILKKDYNSMQTKFPSFTQTAKYSSILIKELSFEEVSEFRIHMHKFNQVLNLPTGRTYELKDNSFFQHYKKNK